MQSQLATTAKSLDTKLNMDCRVFNGLKRQVFEPWRISAKVVSVTLVQSPAAAGSRVTYFDSLPNQQHAALWALDGSIQDLGTLASDNDSAALLINHAGHVAGYSRYSVDSGHRRSFFWTEKGGMIDIGRLPKHSTAPSVPAGLNNHDQIIGDNDATYLWSPTIGLLQIEGMNHPAYSSLNDAGQFLCAEGLATPIMHVSLTASQNPAKEEQSVTFTANVSAVVGLPPNGEKISFVNGKAVIGFGVLTNGVARLTTASLKAGTHSIIASYPGDDNYFPSKSSVLTEIINP
jgi:Bacterial Ig-like domain (group 3)